MTSIQAPATIYATISVVLLWCIIQAIPHPRRTRTSRLRGPKNISIVFGFYRYLQEQDNPAALYEQWVEEYGPAFSIPGPLGSRRIMICDPKANTHFYARETYGYVQTKLAHTFIENLVRKAKNIEYSALRLIEK